MLVASSGALKLLELHKHEHEPLVATPHYNETYVLQQRFVLLRVSGAALSI